jgi:hypothetical protein
VGTIDDNVYDLAVSFAGEQRNYVEQVVRNCQELGLRVFYDRDKNNEWWGKNFIRQQRVIYSSLTRFFVPFISTEYLAKPIPADEFSAAMMTAVNQGDGYVLPVLVGDVQVPQDLLHPHIHYLHASDYTPEQLAHELAQRVGKAAAAGQQRRDVAAVVGEAMQLRMPKVVPQDFSKYLELQASFDYLADQFQAAVPQLQQVGFVGTVNRTHDRTSIRVERSGQTVYSLDIYRGGSFGDDKLTFGLDHNRLASSGISGYATPFFDKETQTPKLRMMNFSVLPQSLTETHFTKQQLFEQLWNAMVDRLQMAT